MPFIRLLALQMPTMLPMIIQTMSKHLFFLSRVSPLRNVLQPLLDRCNHPLEQRILAHDLIEFAIIFLVRHQRVPILLLLEVLGQTLIHAICLGVLLLLNGVLTQLHFLFPALSQCQVDWWLLLIVLSSSPFILFLLTRNQSSLVNSLSSLHN